MPPDSPPIIIEATQGDNAVRVEQSIIMFTEWTKGKIPAELLVYEKGPQCLSNRKLNLPVDHLTYAFEQWLKSSDLLNNGSK